MSRPVKQLKVAIEALTHMLKNGPIKAADVVRMLPASPQTLARAKKQLGLVSVKTSKGWFWQEPKPATLEILTTYNSSNPFDIPGIPMIDKTKPVLEMEEDDDPLRCTTQDLILYCNDNIFKSLQDLINECCVNAAAYPPVIPYTREYIESVVRYVVDGTPIRKDLNKNEEKY